MVRGAGTRKGPPGAGAAAALALFAFAPQPAAAGAFDGINWEISGAEAAAAIVENVTAYTEAGAILVQRTVDNVVFEENVSRTALIQSAFNDNTGIINVNQSAGNTNVQANLRAIALAPGAGALQHAEADALMELRGNTIVTDGPTSAAIDSSFNDTVGIVGINQAAGSLNQQANVLSLTLGVDAGPDAVILEDSSLQLIGTAADNSLTEDPTDPRDNTTTNSFDNFIGIAQVNKVSGHLNRVHHVLAISVQTP